MDVEIKCPACGFSKTLPEEKIPRGIRWAVCPGCRHRFEFAAVETITEQGTGSPWERRMETGLWKGILKTFAGVLFSPGELFGEMRQGKGIKEPFSFGLLMGSLGHMIGFFWEFLLVSMGMMTYNSDLFSQIPMARMFLVAMILSPVLVIINMFIAGVVMHVLLLILRGGRGGFEGTFRVIAYGQATRVLAVVPFIGGVAGWFWNIAVLIIGIKEIHGTSHFKAMAAVILPIALKAILIACALFLVSIFSSIGTEMAGYSYLLKGI